MEQHFKTLLFIKDASLKNSVQYFFKKQGVSVICCDSTQAFNEAIEKNTLCFVQVEMTDEKQEALIKLSLENKKCNVVILLTPYDFEKAKQWIHLGAWDVKKAQTLPEELFLIHARYAKHALTNKHQEILQDQEDSTFDLLLTRNKELLDIVQIIKKVAKYKTTCLLLGESGTGKELLAKALHEASDRKHQAFVSINCGAIPENLLESELFGYVKGAFTGANQDKIGLFEKAHMGTMFLDEIGELPLLLQVKLLRVLQEEEIRPVGSLSSKKIDVRIVAATHKNLLEQIEKGHFREDLFYRLNVLPLNLPPLRDRTEDIPILLRHFIGQANKRLKKKVKEFSPAALKLLMDFSWPGNVRQLQNVVERSVIMAMANVIEPEHLPEDIRPRSGSGSQLSDQSEFSIKKATSQLERRLIQSALEKVAGNRTKAAKLLEISHRALIYKIKDYDLE